MLYYSSKSAGITPLLLESVFIDVVPDRSASTITETILGSLNAISCRMDRVLGTCCINVSVICSIDPAGPALSDEEKQPHERCTLFATNTSDRSYGPGRIHNEVPKNLVSAYKQAFREQSIKVRSLNESSKLSAEIVRHAR